MMLPRQSKLLLLIYCCLLLSGCISSLMSKLPIGSFNEQLYVDARLYFAIKHPLDWERLQIPVSSPEYRPDTVRWRVNDLQHQDRGAGEMLIRSMPSNDKINLQDLLSAYLASQPELQKGQVEKLTLPSGTALKLLGHDDKHGCLTLALKGQKRDFIISLNYPSSRFDELLPTFQDIVKSFAEVIKPATETE